MPTDEYHPRTAERLVEILRAQSTGARSWQAEAAFAIERTIAITSSEPTTTEVVAASDAMRDLRKELIAQPLASIWVQLARAALTAAERVRSLNAEQRGER